MGKNESETRKANMNRIMDYLAEEGYRPKLDSDGDVGVKVQGTNICVSQSADDLNFYKIFMLLTNNIAHFSHNDLSAEVKVTRKIKAVKVYSVSPDTVFIGVECLYQDVEQLLENLERIFQIIQGSIRMYVEEVKKQMDFEDDDEEEEEEEETGWQESDGDEWKGGEDDDDGEWWKNA